MIQISEFFNHSFFFVVGKLFTLIAVVSISITFISWVLGITLPLWRLGLGRWARKIAIVADDETFNVLKIDLTASGIFREKNIKPITRKHLATVRNYSLVIVHYQSFSNEEDIRQLLNNKRSTCGMIFYYPEFNPATGDKIPGKMIQEIGEKENTIVVNFRGRLLNDIIITLITTSYQKK